MKLRQNMTLWQFHSSFSVFVLKKFKKNTTLHLGIVIGLYLVQILTLPKYK